MWQSWDARQDVPGPTHVRTDRPGGGKDVRWRSGDTWGLGDHQLDDLVYLPGGRLPLGRAVVLVEGEKAADAVAELGYEAIATVCGASSTPGDAVLALLSVYSLTVSPDNDEVGRRHMSRILVPLERIGLREARIVDPPAGAAAGWDLADEPAAVRRSLVADARPLLGLGARGDG